MKEMTVITVITPITIPSNVRTERSRFARNEAKAIPTASHRFIYLTYQKDGRIDRLLAKGFPRITCRADETFFEATGSFLPSRVRGGGGLTARFDIGGTLSEVRDFPESFFQSFFRSVGLGGVFGFGLGSGFWRGFGRAGGLGRVAFIDKLIRFSEGSTPITWTLMTSPNVTASLASRM
jgi:hypothetical protein